MSKDSKPDSSGVGKYGGVRPKGTGPYGAEALGEVDADLLREALTAVLTAGDAILLGTTRDGGAVAIQAYSGDQIDKLYGSSVVELEVVLSGVRDAAKG